MPVRCVLLCGRAPLRLSLGAVCRFVVGLGSLTALCLAFPACSSSLPALLAVTAAVGVAYSVAFGTSHQLVPRFTQRSTVALNTGVQEEERDSGTHLVARRAGVGVGFGSGVSG